MSGLRKLERDRAIAELSAIQSLIDSLTDEDVMSRLSLEDRADELRKAISHVKEFQDGTASVVLFFGGRPVVGQRGVESEFAGNAVAKFQDIVSKLVVHEIGALGSRGPVPNKLASTMHITSIVRGSFGFLMEELQSQGQLIDTALSKAVEDASKLMSAFVNEDEDTFEAAASDVDSRVLATTGEFFNLLKDNSATLRLVSGEHDDAFSSPAIDLAVRRADITTVTEATDAFPGQLAGTLPDGHMFEFKRSGGDVIRGRVAKSISAEQLLQWNLTLLNEDATATLSVRCVFKDGALARESYTLLDLNLGWTGGEIPRLPKA